LAPAVEEHAELLGQVDIFAGLDRVALARLAARLQPRGLAEGEVLCHQGDPGDGLYVISQGRIGIFVGHDNGSGTTNVVRLGSRGRGDVLGEMAILTGEGRSATLRAEGPAEVLVLDRGSFVDAATQDPTMALAVAATLSRRLRTANAAIAGAPAREERDSPAIGRPGSSEVPKAPESSAPSPRESELAPRKQLLVALALTAVIVAIAWAIPVPPGLSARGWQVLVPLFAIIPLLVFGALPEGALALLLASLWALIGVSPSLTLGGFATSEWVLIVAVGAIGAVITSTGLLYRLVLWGAHHSPRGYFGQVLALGLAGLVSSAAVPSATSRVLLIAPLSNDLAEALGYHPGSRPAAGLSLSVLLGFGVTAGPFLTSSGTALLIYALLPDSARFGLDWTSWAVRALPLYLVSLLIVLGYVAWRFGPRANADAGSAAPRRIAGVLKVQRTILGRPTLGEQLVGYATIAALIGFATQPVHHVDPAWIAVGALTILSLGGVLTAQTIRSIDWNFVLFYGILASVGGIFRDSQIDRWIATSVAAALNGHTIGPLAFVGMAAGLSFVVGLAVRYTAAAPLLTIALSPVALNLGINPWIVGIVALVATNAFLLPHQSAQYQALYSATSGRLFTHRDARSVAIVYLVASFLALAASVPWWHALGLL
jgi:DASS family divalent anion:Na+ symporter